jgi:hypothetical protein
MRWHKIVAHIVLLILSVINLASAAPLLVQEIHEVRVDVVDVPKNKITTLQKGWDTPDKWRRNAAGWTNTPPSARSSHSDHWSEQELGVHNARSPKTDPNASPQPRLGLTDDHPLNQGPSSVQGNLNINSNASLQPRVGSTDNSQPLDPGPPSAKGSLNTDPNASPQPGLESTADSRPLDPGPSLAHGNLNVDSNIDPPPSVGPIGNSDQAGPSSAPNINPSPSVGPTGSHPTGSGERMPTNDPFLASSPEQGLYSLNDPYTWEKDPYYSWSSATSSPGGSWQTWNGMSDGRSSPHDSPASETGPADDSPPSSPSSAHGNPNVSPPSDPGSTPSHPPPAPPSDAGPSTGPHPQPSSESPQHGSETFLDDLFKGKFKRRISGSHSVNAAQREMQGTF